jgi:hypothetical protein
MGLFFLSQKGCVEPISADLSMFCFGIDVKTDGSDITLCPASS